MSDRLTLVQWMSPAFPVGCYAYSHGLEAAVAAGDVSGATDLAAWLADVLRLGAGRADATILAAVLQGGDPGALSEVVRALAASKERWEETSAQGRAFAQAVGAASGEPLVAWPYPVAVGVAARRLEVPPQEVVEMYLHAFTSNLVSAAVRFVPLGQGAGQAVLASLQPVIAGVAAEAMGADPEAIAGFVPRGDLASMQHEGLDVRIFKT